ncbi:MAG: type II toxin-antitoxin system RelE/ParE family toxin [Chloroflexi bacterium]|nr:type II toxin-antitoxin system RelE/ParE family toxin [Chloroflexota bacterium]
MASYRIEFKRSAEKDLRKAPKNVIKRVFRQIDALAEEPLPRQAVKLTGQERLFRIRVGDYRIIYEILPKESVVVIHYIRHRREAYR